MKLHDDIMPHLANPKLLIDFLKDSYDVGGAIAVLPLEALFFLIHEHNL